MSLPDLDQTIPATRHQHILAYGHVQNRILVRNDIWDPVLGWVLYRVWGYGQVVQVLTLRGASQIIDYHVALRLLVLNVG